MIISTSNPFLLRSRLMVGATEAIDAESRLQLLKDMNREQLNDVVAWPTTQKTVKAAALRRLKQFDAWGYGKVVVRFQNGTTETFHKQGSERSIRRWAMLKSHAVAVVEISEPCTREEWLRGYGDGKARM